jgi:exosortase/archaeosortase family protein
MVRSERFRFAVAFGLACLGFHALVLVLPSSFYRVICEHTARTMTLVLDAFGFPVVACSNIVSGGGLLFQIVLECTALSMVGLFICFVCFYHAEAHRKTIGLAMGIPALYLGNLARLVLIFVVSWHNPGLFGIVHVYLGQVFTMLLVILACILWLRWVNTGSPPGPAKKVAGFFCRFLVISGCIFLFWLEFHHCYIWLLDRLMIVGFSFFGHRLFFPPNAAVYYETFDIVTFASLILATRSAPWARKGKILAAGLGLFFLLHLFHRVDNALISAFHYTPLLQPDLFLCDLGQYALPVLLWLALAIRRSPDRGKNVNAPRVEARQRRA